MKEINNDNVDLTLIKENDLEKTAAFTDLMSRSERKKYRRQNVVDDETVEFKTDDILMQVSEEKKANLLEDIETKEIDVKVVKNKKKKKKEKETLKEREERFDEELSKTNKLFELTNQININKAVKTKPIKKSNIVTTIILSISILALLAYYIYTIIFTKFQDNELYLLINGINLLVIVLLYCVVIISNKKLSLIVSIINFIFITSFITFNTLIYLNII